MFRCLSVFMYIVLIMYLVSSCNGHPVEKENAAESLIINKILSVYNKNDSLVFKSANSGKLDTLVITDLDTVANESSSLFIESYTEKEIYLRYKEIHEDYSKNVWYEYDQEESKMIQKEEDKYLIAVSFFRNLESPRISFNFRDFSQTYQGNLPEALKDTLYVNGEMFNNYMLLENERRNSKILKLYFSYKRGLIAYIDSNNDVWSIINR